MVDITIFATWVNFLRCFRALCIAIATSLIIYFIYLFSLNEDLCTIDYKVYHDNKQDVYPTLSLCFINSFSDVGHNIQDTHASPKAYLEFLRGNHFETKMLKVNYSTFSININDYLTGEYILYRNGNYVHNYLPNISRPMFKPSYSGFLGIGDFYNCFAWQIPQEKEISAYGGMFKTSIFHNSSRSPFFGMITYLHYPNQLMVAGKTKKYTWPERERYDKFEMKFLVNGVEILRRRNKMRQPCIENWQNYDDAVLVNHLNKIKCRSPYQNPSIEYPLCNTKDEIKNSHIYLNEGEISMHPPCKAMEKVYYTFQETNLEGTEWGVKDRFWAGIYLFDHQFKEILKTK